MKKREMNKKLNLNKSTVAHLEINIMANAKGGNLHVSWADPEACGGGGDSDLYCDSQFVGCETATDCNSLPLYLCPFTDTQ